MICRVGPPKYSVHWELESASPSLDCFTHKLLQKLSWNQHCVDTWNSTRHMIWPRPWPRICGLLAIRWCTKATWPGHTWWTLCSILSRKNCQSSLDKSFFQFSLNAFSHIYLNWPLSTFHWLHCTTLRYFKLLYNILHYFALLYSTFHYFTLLYTTPPYFVLPPHHLPPP